MKKRINARLWCVLLVPVVVLLAAGCTQKTQTYPNASLLITGDQLEELINAQTTNMVIIDARAYGNASQKIPGSNQPALAAVRGQLDKPQTSGGA
jgi:hypothetical protein